MGNSQDYGKRFYDDRVGRFLSVDPLVNKYPELSSYLFASDRPIDGVDLNGMEYMKSIPKFDYTGGLMDYISALDNGVIDVVNVVPTLWNSGVANYQALRSGTWSQEMGSELKQDAVDIKHTYVSYVNYTNKTPYLTQLSDAGKTLISPQTVEFGVSLYVSAKIPLGGTKGNLTTVEKAVAPVILEESGEALAEQYAKTRPQFRSGVIEKVWKNAAENSVDGVVRDPNTREIITWNKNLPRRGQWEMGHIRGSSYKQLVEDLRTGKINQQQFLDEYNNPDNYKPEKIGPNRSRKYN